MTLERVRTMSNDVKGDAIHYRVEVGFLSPSLMLVLNKLSQTDLEKEDGTERDVEEEDESMKSWRRQEDESQKELTQLFKRLQPDAPLNLSH